MTKLPNFFDVDLDNYNQQLQDLLNKYRQSIANLTKQDTYSWQSLMLPLEEMDDELGQFWSPVSHIHSVVNNEKLREVYKVAVGDLSDYSTEIGQNRELYQAIKQVKPEDAIQAKILEDEIKSFELSGVALEGEAKSRYGEIQSRLSQLSTEFETNLLDATNHWKKTITDPAVLKGLPEHALNTAKALAKSDNEYLLTLDFPCFHAVMTYAENRQLREEMYHAFVTRASDQGPDANKFDNSQHIKEILALKHELANLLGFENYAEYSLATKMAPSTQKVRAFLDELTQKTQAQAKSEFEELKTFATTELAAWDISFYSEKLREEKYAVSQEALRAYFPQNKVINGMFLIINKLYGIHFEEKTNVSTWHPDVKFYELYQADGNCVGGVYMDLYARENKQGGAWMDDCIGYRILDKESIQTPVAYLTCNFAPPVADEEAYFSHDEVVTFFHEFGHCLHHLLTKVPYLAASGINGVEWDAVELPSQFLENWCWQKEALGLLTKHKETGKAISDEDFDKLNSARNFQSAMAMMRQLEFAIFDFKIHQDYKPESPDDVLTVLNDIRKKSSVIPYPEYNRFPHGFSHIFAGGYAAGYYSYKWAEVLSSDTFDCFEQEGIFNPQTGQRFLNEILSKGSSRKALESFMAFRGREPQVDALMRHSGIVA